MSALHLGQRSTSSSTQWSTLPDPVQEASRHPQEIQWSHGTFASAATSRAHLTEAPVIFSSRDGGACVRWQPPQHLTISVSGRVSARGGSAARSSSTSMSRM